MEYQIRRIDNVIYGPQIDINIDRRGLGRTIFDTMKKHNEKVMQIDAYTDESQSYEYVNKKCVRIAMEMRCRGIREKDVVLVCSGNNLDTAALIYSTLYLNAVAVTLDPALSFIDTIHLIKTVSPKFMFVIESLIDQMEHVLAQIDINPEIVVIGQHETYPILSDFLRPQPAEDQFKPDYVDDVDSTTMIFFTSGTTGLPKAVRATHYGLLSGCVAASIDTMDANTVICYTSFLCSAGFVVAMIMLFFGGKRIVVEKFTPETFLKFVENYKVTYCFLPTTYAIAFNDDNTKKYSPDCLVEMRVGGGPISNCQMNNLKTYFPETNIYKLYGVKESLVWISTFSKFSDSLARIKPTSIGVPFVNMKVKVVDIDTERKLGPNERGEIRVSNNFLTRNYMHSNNEERMDNEGYLKTGDIGVYDEDNCLHFYCRTNDAFKYQNWFIVPATLEATIYEHPAVQEAVVIGVPVELDDHHPMALVILKDSHIVTEKELLTFVDDRLSDRCQLRAGLKIVKKFPKTYTGKVPRQVLRQMVLTGNMKQLT